MTTKKSYCTQNDSDCSTCSLVNYNRDCMNNPVDEPGAGEPVEVTPLDRSRFELEMSRAKTFQELEPDRADYWAGYQRGLRKAYHGEKFGTAAEHALWCEALHSDDEQRKMRGKGYRHGLRGVYDPLLCRLIW